MKSIISMFATLFLLAVLAGCGQSGPLYVPGDPSSIETPAKVPDSVEEEEEDENGEDDDSQ